MIFLPLVVGISKFIFIGITAITLGIIIKNGYENAKVKLERKKETNKMTFPLSLTHKSTA